MNLTPLITWIDREWDPPSRAKYSLGLILSAVWFPLMLIGWSVVTLTIGALWSALWIGLYGWRWVAAIDRLDTRYRRRKRR